MRRMQLGLTVIAAGLVGACASHAQPAPDVPSTQVTVTSGTIESGDLDDPQIATIAESIRDGLEERARIAVDRANDAAVRRFAQRLLADDAGVSITLMNLAPRASILDDELASDTHAAADGLAARSGADFDHAYVLSTHDALRSAIHVIDQRLVPTTDSMQLRANLLRMRATLQQELRDLDAIPTAPTR